MIKTDNTAQTTESISTITNALMEDLFNPSITTLDLCNLHGLSLHELATALESETFKQAAESFQRINAARLSIIEPEAVALATARLADQLKDHPESPAHAETQRKAATKLISPPPGLRGRWHAQRDGGGLAPLRSTSPSPRSSQNIPILKDSSLKTNNPPLNCSRTAANVTACESVVDSHTHTGRLRKNPPMNTKLIALGAIAAATTFASAQSFNVDFGSLDTSPPNTYAAVGLAGEWNTFDNMPNFQQFPLLGLDGSPIAANIKNIGFDFIELLSIPGTQGADEALLDDCYTSQNDPVDGCIFLNSVEPGEYQVIMYALTPDDNMLINRLRIDQNTEDPEFVGGSWSGAHQEGVTYMTQTATVGLDGRLDIHSGLFGGNIRSVMNGFQVIQVQPCPADLNNDGDLNFFDVSAFLAAFAAQDPAADFNDDGQYNFFDVSAFLSAFTIGCP